MSWVEGDAPDDLSVDEAQVNLLGTSSPFTILQARYEECVHCPFRDVQYNYREKWYRVPTKGAMTLRVLGDSTDTPVCSDINAELGEFGIYNITVTYNDTDQGICQLETIKEPVNIYYPLIVVCLLAIGLAVLSVIATRYVKRYLAERGNHAESLDSNSAPKSSRKRVESIDTFRGIAILMMIFVNDGAGQYSLFEHAAWDGLHMADLCFPWFMWIMGVCIPMSLKGNLKRGLSRGRIYLNAVKRSVILFGSGLLLNTVGGGSNLDYLRIPGVLQRFSVVYLIIITIALFGMLESKDGPQDISFFKDFTTLQPMWLAVIILVTIHTCVVFLGEVPDCPTGYLGPGIGPNCTGGMTGYVDRVILGVEHIYILPTCYEIFQCGPFDPEGILGILTSCLSVMLGVQAGSTLIHYYDWKGRTIRWCVWGLVNAVLAAILAAPGYIPINKNLWSLSFVFTTSAAAFFLLAIIYTVQDYYKLWNGVPFKAPGMNPIILFLGHEIAYNLFPFHFRIGVNNTHLFFTFEALWGVFLWTIIAYIMYFNRFFLSI